jgi:hypothetical protein
MAFQSKRFVQRCESVAEIAANPRVIEEITDLKTEFKLRSHEYICDFKVEFKLEITGTILWNGDF